MENSMTSTSIQFLPPKEDIKSIICITLDKTDDFNNLEENSVKEEQGNSEFNSTQLYNHTIRAPEGPVGFTPISRTDSTLSDSPPQPSIPLPPIYPLPPMTPTHSSGSTTLSLENTSKTCNVSETHLQLSDSGEKISINLPRTDENTPFSIAFSNYATDLEKLKLDKVEKMKLPIFHRFFMFP